MAENEINVLGTEVYEVEMEEVLPPVVSQGGTMNHALLNNREVPNQHPIIAIEGLREELDNIEALKENFSNKYGHANYYLWADGGGEINERVGLFVSACEGDCSKIEVCNRGAILGVSVDTAAFIGNRVDPVQTKCNVCGNVVNGHRVACSNIECQSHDVDYIRKIEYGLVATSGVVLVRCESDVVLGDYVMPNAVGVAAKVDNEYGYQVIEVDNVLGIPYAAIDLDATTSLVYGIGIEVDEIATKVRVNEQNIVSAINVSNQAYNKAQEASNSSSVSEEAVKKALESILSSEEKIEEFEQTVGSASAVSAQARAIAESAVTEAASMKTEAVNRANDAWAKADEVQTETYSLCAKIDKHSVGEYSQAYGLTLEQAQGILEIGMIYVPTRHKDNKTHTEEYLYDVGGETKTYERTFTPGYLYEWREIPNSEIGIGWVTVDQNYNSATEADADETNPINTSAMAVYFSSIEIVVGNNNNYGYWYTTSEDILDSAGQPTDKYQPYTLYHWEDTHWVAVATLQGNASNRMVSEIYQTTNEIMMSVINPRGGIAGFDAKLTDTEATMQNLAAWKNGESTNEAIIRQQANDDGSSIVIATLQKDGDTVKEMASLVLSASEEDGSALVISADNVNFEATNYTINASKIVLDGETFFVDADGNTTTINGSRIATGSVTTEQMATDAICSNNYAHKDENGNPIAPSTEENSGIEDLVSEEGTFLDLANGSIYSPAFALNGDNAYIKGKVHATQGDFGGLKIFDDSLLISNDEGKLHLYNTGYPRLSVFRSNGNGVTYESTGIIIQKTGKTFGDDSSWLLLANGSTVYSLYLDHDTNTVKFKTVSAEIVFFIGEQICSAEPGISWGDWVKGEYDNVGLCINGDYIGISGAPSGLVVVDESGNPVRKNDGIFNNHHYATGWHS